MTEVSSLTGRLLVATPKLADPNFDRAVVLLLDHDVEGTLGVVLNRPTPVGVGDVLEPWAALAGTPAVVFQGGPVSLDSALALAVVPGEPRQDSGTDTLGWRRVHGAIGMVDLEAPPELLAAELGSLRIFAGYSGWARGSWRRNCSTAPGTWWSPNRVTSPRPTRSGCGAPCCAGSATSWPWWPRIPTIRVSIRLDGHEHS